MKDKGSFQAMAFIGTQATACGVGNGVSPND